MQELSIEDALRVDRFRLRRSAQQIDRLQREGRDASGPRAALQRRLAESVAARQQRQAAAAVLNYPDELPITAHREAIVSLIRQRQVVVVCGETGSGKSTQLPKFCLEAGLGRDGMIGHTQPRRLAARSIAARLAEEMSTRVGELVGFKIRFADSTVPQTLVKLMTDGILLAETQSDRFLDQYDAIIIDEAHERSLNIDFLLGYLRRLQAKRPDLRILITSATIDAERFAEHFADEAGPAPIVNVEGRGFPVEMRYLPWEAVAGTDEAGDPRSYDVARHVVAGVDEILAAGPGDALVFLPTERDIREVSHRVAGHLKRQGSAGGGVQLLPLYARLPQNEQQQIFNPSGGGRRIVFATNVAESSLTVPGIRYVIDSGTARISRYSPRSKVQRLPIEPVSRASADQRAGRCGRIAPGICIRLFSQQDYESREPYTTPEIRRTNLASVILQTKVLRLGAIEEFPFIDPPRNEAIREGLRTLHEIGALDQRDQLTDIGRQLGRMPVDPRVGRMVLAADDNGVLPEVLVIAAALEIQDPRERPPDKQQAADEAQQMFRDPRSDFLGYLRIWDFYHQQKENLSRGQLQKACRSRFLSYTRMREWVDVHRQLREMVAGMKTGGKAKSHRLAAVAPEMDDNRYALVHQSLLTGLLAGVALAGDKKEYTGAGGLQLYLWPGSGVFEAKPKWIVAAELVETTRRYARTVAKIQPEWLEQLAAHLVKHSYSDPHWSRKAGGAFCYQRVTLFGLPVVARRRVPLAPVDPATARELLIEDGLVQRQLPTRARCVQHERNLRDSVADLAAKTRRRDLVVDPYAVQRFYQERLAESVTDRTRLERWDQDVPTPDWAARLQTVAGLAEWLEHPPQIDVDPLSPYMRPEDLLPEVTLQVVAEAFPDALDLGNTRLPLQYHYEPGSQRDGVTITVPHAALSQVSDDRLGWLVPGLLEAKLTAMIKALPKRIRRNLVPAADVAREVCRELAPRHGQVPFMPAVCLALSRRAEMPIQPSDFSGEKLPDHMQVMVQVVDDHGNTLAAGRGMGPVREQLGEAADEAAAAAGDSEHGEIDQQWSGEALTSFDVDSLPEQVIRRRGGVQVAQFPGLVDQGDCVSVRVFSDARTAEAATRRGLTRLYAIAERKELRSQVRWLPQIERSRILLAGVLPPDQFEPAMADLIARMAFVDGQPIARTREAFDARRQDRGRRIAEATQEIARWLPQWADAYQSARSQWESTGGDRFGYAVADTKQQVQRLTQKGFLASTPWQWLQHYPRYFAGIAYRLDKLRSGSLQRDRDATEVVSQLHQRTDAVYAAMRHSVGVMGEDESAELEEVRWMVEELRISLFAQPLGTAIKVSPQRCEKLLSRLETAAGQAG